MSKMPALFRSFHRTSLNVLSSSVFLGSWFEALKSGTAMRIFSTPRPVPVLIQSWAGDVVVTASKTTKAEKKNLKPQRTQRNSAKYPERGFVLLCELCGTSLWPLWLKALSFDENTQSPLVIEPEFDAHFASVVIR